MNNSLTIKGKIGLAVFFGIILGIFGAFLGGLAGFGYFFIFGAMFPFFPDW